MSTWIRAAQDLWFGDDAHPYRGEFHYVLTVSKDAPRTDDGLRHRHLRTPARPEDFHPLLDQAVSWVEPRWWAGNKVLVASPDWVWAEMIVAALFVHLGASTDEAIVSLRLARPEALFQPQLRDLLGAWEVPRA